jgi:electron transport complex protein RnfD
MSEKNTTSFVLSQAPHIRDTQNINIIMWYVVASLVPAAAFSVWTMGLSALLVMISAVVSAVLAEFLFRKAVKRSLTIHNGSAVLTGLLLAMNLPPEVPLWIPVVGSAFAIIIVKELFGGLGYNIFNPALAARAFLMASWPTLMTTKWHAFENGSIFSQLLTNKYFIGKMAYDSITGATPLAAINLKSVQSLLESSGTTSPSYFETIFQNDVFFSMALGNIGGCIGETSAILLLVGAIFLLWKKIIRWEIPVAYFLSFSLVILLYFFATGFEYPFRGLLFHLLGGGLFLGALYMATDMVTSPVTSSGMLIYAAGGGILASVIRIWGGYPEGVSYSILLMNAAVPLIDRLVKPRIYGSRGGK